MNRITRRVGIAIAVFIIVSGSAFAEEVKVAGGGAAINTVFKPVAPYFEKATGLYLVSIQSTPKDGLVSLLNGSADAAAAAVSLQSMIGGAEKDGLKVDAASLQQLEIATCKTVVFVHPSNPVSKLSKDHLQARSQTGNRLEGLTRTS